MVVVYDIETLSSCFTYSAINVKTEEKYQFVLHKDKNDWFSLVNHLQECIGQIGFNNINFDYPIIHYILENMFIWPSKYNVEQIITLIYQKAQEIINTQDTDEFYKTVAIPIKNWKIKQLDLFKLWHYNNKARKTSLKALEISMNFPNVMEMPIEHTKEDITLEEVKDILEYNMNDVLATFEFYKKSREKIDLRKTLKQTYDIPCLNWSDSKIGEQLILKLYCDKTNFDVWEVKQQRTFINNIIVGDIIFNYIKFNSKEFTNLLNKLRTINITKTKGAFEESVVYKGFKYDLGQGGIHGCVKPGVYESDDDYIIIDADVASLYPNIAIKNGLFIEHLGKEFIDIYDNDIVKKRLQAKKDGETAIADALKLSANSVYGKSNDVNSFLYDPKYTMATTINGQLMLCMLAEMLVDNIVNLKVLQINTDGITVKIPRLLEPVYNEICKEWQRITNLELEYVNYSKMVIRDVNNYLAVSEKGKVKYKGAFEIDKVVGNEPAYHKDNSFRIIPYAISEYFVNKIPIEYTIKKHTNIYDFCGRQKFGKDSYGMVHFLEDNEEKIQKQQKNVRYYISKPGAVFVKYYTKGTSELINKGYSVTIFNNYIEKQFSEYNIDYSFYINECRKIIDVIEDKQLSLF